MRARVCRREPPPLTDEILRDDDLLMSWVQRVLEQTEGHRALTKRVLALQARLRRAADQNAWAAYLDLEQAEHDRAADEFLVLVRRACKSDADLGFRGTKRRRK